MNSNQKSVTVFSISFALMIATQAIMITVIPLQAYTLFGSAQAVGWMYVLVGTANVFGRLFVPLVLRYLARLQVFFSGIALLVAGAVLLTSSLPIIFSVGFLLQAVALSWVEIVLTLFMFENVRRADLTRFEQKRILLSAIGWFVGPWLGVALKAHVSDWVPNATQIAIALTLMLYFGFRSFDSSPDVRLPKVKSKPFWTYVLRYVAQPRLRLAWLLAFGRASWWGMFFVYAPIFAVAAGLDDQFGGAIVSAGTLWSATVLLWGKVAERIGIRRLLIAGFMFSAFFTACGAMLMSNAWVGSAFLVLAAAATASIDAAGNTLFLRAVRARERSEMTAVFISFRDFAQLLPPAGFSVFLAFFSLPGVFGVGATMMVILAFFARYIPRTF
jgi:MFS family permease